MGYVKSLEDILDFIHFFKKILFQYISIFIAIPELGLKFDLIWGKEEYYYLISTKLALGDTVGFVFFPLIY